MGSFLSALIFAGGIQGFFLSFLIYKNKNLNRSNKTFLICILMFFSVNIIINETLQKMIQNRLEFVNSSIAFQLFLGPMIYFYVKSLTNSQFKHDHKDILHFIPMFIFLIYIAIVHLDKDLISSLTVANRIIWLILPGQLFIYLLAVRIKIRKYNESLKENFSFTEEINLNWLNFIFLSLFSVIVLYTVLIPVFFHRFLNFNQILSLVLSLFIYVLGYKSLSWKNIEIDNVETKADIKDKYLKSKLPDEYSGYWKAKILKYLEDEKSYLDPELSLSSLSESLNLPANHLSQIINADLNSTFYDLINNYRINEVKKQLKECSGKNILDIAFDSGFNSKTTFNKVFKKVTGFTPKDYKNIN